MYYWKCSRKCRVDHKIMVLTPVLLLLYFVVHLYSECYSVLFDTTYLLLLVRFTGSTSL